MSDAPPIVTRRAVAALFLERQHLTAPRRRSLSPARLTRFVEDAGGLQLDTINVIDRAHHLTLFSRFGPYDRTRLARLVYRRRLLFEYWAHAACMVPITHLAPWRRAMLDYQRRNRAWGAWLKHNRRVIAEVERAIRESGPLGSADFENRRPRGAGAGWWNWKPATHALDYLWMSGVTLVDSRVHFQKRFALAERVLPQLEGLTPPDTAAFRRWHLRRSLHAMGAATETDLRMYLTFPRIEAGDRRRLIREALADGEVVEVVVMDDATRGNGAGGARGDARRGTKTRAPRWLALADDLPALARAGRRRTAARGTTLLSPFDSLLWHRDRVKRLFGFDYTIEVYVPGPKRVHGYYSLPIFHDGQLIGRVDAKTHREERRLEVKHVHFEPWFADHAAPPVVRWGEFDHAAATTGLGDAVRALAVFVGAERIELRRVTPARMAAEVRRALG
jgi:uncharacterized protein